MYESDGEEHLTEEKPQEVLDEFILALPIDTRRMLAVVVESFQKMNTMDLAQEAASIAGYKEKTVIICHKKIHRNRGELNKETGEI